MLMRKSNTVTGALFIFIKLQSVKSQTFTHSHGIYRHIYIHTQQHTHTAVTVDSCGGNSQEEKGQLEGVEKRGGELLWKRRKWRTRCG